MIQQIIEYADGVLDGLDYFTKVHGLCELVTDGDKTYPAKYCTGGKYESVSKFSNFNGSCYWRQLSPPTVANTENSMVSNRVQAQINYVLRLVVAVKKSQLPTDNEYSTDTLCRDLMKNLSQKANTLKSSVKAKRVEFNSTSWETNSGSVFSSEYVEAGQDKLSSKIAYAYLDFNVLILANRSCLTDLCPTP